VEPFGEGLGSIENEHSVSGNEERIGPHDSSLLETLYSLGWFGTLLYLVALASIFARLFHHPEKSSPFGIVARTILVGFAAQFLLNSILLGVLGFVVWSFVAICLAEIRERKPDTFAQLEGTPVAVPS
jgi:RsiW-degrading membrane proteinase PrsW (M82 family)